MRRLRTVLKNEYKYLLRQQILQESRRDLCFADGYLSRKRIAGKDRMYFQFTDQGKLCSVYLTGPEAELVKERLEQKNEASEALADIRADLSDICVLLSGEEQKQCRETVLRLSLPVLKEPLMEAAVGLSGESRLLYFWKAECADRERHLWRYMLSFRWKRQMRTVECGLLNEDIRHNVRALQAYAGWIIDEYVREQELKEAAAKLVMPEPGQDG